MTAVAVSEGGPGAPVFRAAMSRLVSSVHVITTRHDGVDAGLTATAVCSVSDDPPSLLVCVHTRSRVHDVIAASEVLIVNTLGAQHEELAGHFAGRRGFEMADRFKHASWHRGKTGALILDECVASFECVVDRTIEFGTHRILVCRILAIDTSKAARGLAYGGRSFMPVDLGE